MKELSDLSRELLQIVQAADVIKSDTVAVPVEEAGEIVKVLITAETILKYSPERGPADVLALRKRVAYLEKELKNANDLIKEINMRYLNTYNDLAELREQLAK